MSSKDTYSQSLSSIAKKIQSASGVTTSMTIEQMASNFPTVASNKTVDLNMASGNQTISETGTIFKQVTVTKPDTLIPDNIKNGVVVAGVTGTLVEGITPTGTISITSNGTVDVTNYASASVNVNPLLQTKTVTANGTVTPGGDYYGLASVTVAIPTYDGTVE